MSELALIDSIYEAPLDHDLPWVGFLDRYRRCVDSPSAQLMFARRKPGAPRGSIDALETSFAPARQIYYGGFDTQVPIRYDELDDGRIATFSDFTSRARFERSAFYEQFGRQYGVRYGLALYLGVFDDVGVWLNASRGGERDYTSDERALTLRLAPHLQRVLRLNPGFGRSRLERRPAPRNTALIGVLLVNEFGGVVRADAAAQEILKGHPCVRCRNDILTFSVGANRDKFVRCLRSVAGAGPGAVRALSCGCDKDRLEMLIERVGASTSQFIVRLHAPGAPEIEVDVLCELFGFTPSEALVALMLVQGKDLKMIGTLRGLSTETVRTYCKRVFAKVGVKRQAEFVSRVLHSVSVLTAAARS
jgi:DNA-binding CsgD family transcriptional regulator